MSRTPVHDLKTDPEMFVAVCSGAKTHEIRKDDRGFAVGDILQLRETVYTGEEMAAGARLVYSNRELCVHVTHIMRGPLYGIKEGWAILSFSRAAGHRGDPQ